MNTSKKIGIVVAIVGIITIVFFVMRKPAAAPTSTKTPTLVSTVTFACSASKSITAAFYDGVGTPGNETTPPVPGGSVVLSLSDGRTMSLTQTLSADGARYANAGESVVLWNKGNGVTFTENNQQTYTGCIALAKDSGGLTQAYSNETQGFSLRYPTGYTVDEAYKYSERGPGTDIGGVKFTIPSSVASGTNLSPDTHVSIEEIPNAGTCSAALFLPSGSTMTTITDNDTLYSVGTFSDAAMGNRYEETVYAISGTNPCIAVRYTVHYGVFENYPTGMIKKFDEVALKAQFDAIRRTLTVL